MVGVDKNKLSDLFKKKDDKEEKKKKAKEALSRMKTTAKKKTPKGLGKTAKKSTKQMAPGVYGTKPSKEKLTAAKASKEKALMHSKTHQDLINVAYKAADELKIAPWVLLRAAKWGHFTDDRGKKYDGPMIDEIDTLEPAQKAALKKVLGL